MTLMHGKVSTQKAEEAADRWEKICTDYATEKELIARIYKQMKNSTTIKAIIQLRDGQIKTTT